LLHLRRMRPSCLVIVLLHPHGVASARCVVSLFGCKRGQGGVGDAKMWSVAF
jgi:hypothetical protein